MSRWSTETDIDGLVAIISAAISARRPRLAARLVNLIDDEKVEIEPGGPVDRARRAARLLLHDGDEAPDAYFSAMEEAWDEAHRERMKRVKRRMRARAAGKTGRESRSGRKDRPKRRK